MDIVASIDQVLDEYKNILGESHIKFFDDLTLAEEELERMEQMRANQDCKKGSDHSAMTTEQRLAEYEQVVAQKQKPSVSLEDLALLDTSRTSEDSSESKKSKLELLALERDLKRRRQTYKGGKAHIAKRSYTEVMREVIEQQSDILNSMMKYQDSDNGSREQSVKPTST